LFGVYVLGFQITLCCRYFRPFFGLAAFWATFSKNWANFVSNLYKKRLFQNKSKFITEDQFTKHMNITIC
jgi:hypothetical protein